MNLLIKAGPGCGKSYTLKSLVSYMLLEDKNDYLYKMSPQQKAINEWCCENLPRTKSILYLAFQRSIADKLKREVLGFCDVYSLNGFGQSCIIKRWGFQNLHNQRGHNLVGKLIGRSLNSLPVKDRMKWIGLLKYLHYVKQEDLMVSIEAFEFIQQKYNPPYPVPRDLESAIDLLNLMATPNRQLEYIDQLWLGVKALKAPKYDIALVDEFQDLSPIMLKLALKSAKNLIFCGDPHQSITRFAGAGDHIYEELQARCHAELPLTESFRIPRNIAEKANRIRPTANLTTVKKEVGEEKAITFSEFLEMVNGADLSKHSVLCRTNAPLISIGLRLIRSGIPVRVARNDIFNRLSYFIKQCYKHENPMDYVYDLMDQKPKSKQQEIINRDLCGIFSAIYNEHAPPSEDAMKEIIDEMLSDKDDPIDLSTIHRAKGLEWENVTILNPPIRHPLAESKAEIEQEINAEYVAVTRTKMNLYWLSIG